MLHARRRRKRDSREFQQFALLRVAGLFDDRRFQRRVMVLRVVLLQDVLHVVRDLVDLEREEQRLGLEIARLQDEQHPTCQAVVAIGHRAFFRCEGEIVDALIVREPGTAVELFDLGVFENCDAVLVSSGHGGSLFLRGRGTHLFVHRAEADPEAEAARHVLGLRPTRPRARAAFNPASVRL